MEKLLHKSVLTEQVLGFLQIKKSEIYIDATFGSGGHAKKIIEAGGKVLGIDVDQEAIKQASERFSVPLNDKYGRLFGETDEG